MVNDESPFFKDQKSKAQLGTDSVMENKIPNGWATTTIGTLAKYVNGRAFKPTEWKTSGKPIIRIQNLNNSDAVFNYSDQEHDEKYIVKHGDLLFAWSASLGAHIWKGNDAWLNQHIFNVIPELGINKSYLYYLLSKITAELYAKAHGSGMVHVTKGKFEETEVFLPPTNEQKRIVAKIEELFSELDNGIAALKTAREQLKIYRQAVLKHAFEGKLTAQWRKDNADKLETPEQLLARIQTERETRYQQQLAEWKQLVEEWEANGKEGKKPSKPKEPEQALLVRLLDEHYLSDIPQNWTCLKAEHLCDFITKGTTPAKTELFANNGDVPFIKVYNLTKDGRLDFSIEPTFVSQETHQGFLARSKVYPKDVLMNIVGPPLGKVSIIPDTFTEWNINQAIAIFRSHILLPKFLAEFLLFEKTVNFMMSQSKATAGQFNLTLEICRELPIPVPSQAEQIELVKKLEEKLSNLDTVAASINEQLAKSETLRQSILKKAFSGQLVAQDPNDEPASELLARIKAEKKPIQHAKKSAQITKEQSHE
jgi:type I restriction enzyme S subunit